MTRGQLEKQQFVVDCLAPVLASIDNRISTVSYMVDQYDHETVRITWETNDGKLHDAVEINVTCDSKAAIVQDVIKIFL